MSPRQRTTPSRSRVRTSTGRFWTLWDDFWGRQVSLAGPPCTASRVFSASIHGLLLHGLWPWMAKGSMYRTERDKKRVLLWPATTLSMRFTAQRLRCDPNYSFGTRDLLVPKRSGRQRAVLRANGNGKASKENEV